MIFIVRVFHHLVNLFKAGTEKVKPVVAVAVKVEGVDPRATLRGSRSLLRVLYRLRLQH